MLKTTRTLLTISLLATTIPAGYLVACGGTDSSTPAEDSGVDATSKVDAGGDTGGPEALFDVSATISGLTGTGLVLQDASGAAIAVPAGTTTVKIATGVKSGTSFDVSVKTQPSGPVQNCVVSGGKGTVAKGNVTSISVNCSDVTYTLGGTVAGLDGKDLILEDSVSGETVTLNANGAFSFAKARPSGTAYNVRLKQDPTANWQTCTVGVAGGADAGAPAGDAGADGGAPGVSGTATANVTNLAVTCKTNAYPVKLRVAGLLGGGAVFQNTGADDLAVAAAVPAGPVEATFAALVDSGKAYNISVFTQPSSPSQTCVVAAPTAKMLGAAVALDVTCTTNKYNVKVDLAGLVGNGLVLQNNGLDDVTKGGAAANGVFAFATPIASGQPYAVTVKTQPPGEVCTVSAGSGTIGAADVTAKVTCAPMNCANNPKWTPVTCTTNQWVWTSSRANATLAAANAAHTLYTGCNHSGVPGDSNGMCSLSGQGWVSTATQPMAGCNATWNHIGGSYTGACGGHDGDTVRRLVLNVNECYDY